MAKTVLDDVYQMLHGIGAVRSESEFSKDWLGRSDCYLRTLRFKRMPPSVGSIAICASKLQHYGQRMLATTEHKQLGERFVGLSNALSSSNILTKQAALDGSTMKWVLHTKYHTAQFLRVRYLCFWGGDFTPPCIEAST